MAHFPTSWEDRIVVEDGKITRILTAIYDKNGLYSELDVYKENEDGEHWCRNIYRSMWGGYSVMFPGQPINLNRNSWYYNPEIAEEEEWTACQKCNLGRSRAHLTEAERGLIIMHHYNFKYVFNKYYFRSLYEVMEKLVWWKLHPEIELLLAAGFERLAMSKQLYRLTDKNKKELLTFVRKHPQLQKFSFRELRECVKSKEPEIMSAYILNVPSYMREGWGREAYTHYPDISFEDFKYLQRRGYDNSNGINLYHDYKRLLRQSEHSFTDEYWRYPSKLQEKHDLLMREVEDQRERERIAERERQELEQAKRDKEYKAKLSKKTSDFQKVCKKYKKFDSELDGYQIYISNDYDDWKRQAEALHQCIVRCDYMQQVADRRCLIIFIRKEGIPVATAQVLPNKKISQFYGDEIDRYNCKPTEEVSNVFNKWLETIDIKEAI